MPPNIALHTDALTRARELGRNAFRHAYWIMPTVLRIGTYRFFFYANENSEPHHIHVQRERALAKFW